MRAHPRTRRSPVTRPLLAGLAVVALVSSIGGPAAAREDDPRLLRAQQERVEVQDRLDGLLSRMSELELQAEEADGRLADLTARADRERAQADSANDALAQQVRESYVHGTADPALAMLVSGSTREAMEQARVLGLLARRSRADYEVAASAQVRTRVASDQVEDVAAELADREDELRGAQDEVTRLVAQAEAQEVAVRETIAAEEVARQRAEAERRERERVASERAARQQVAQAAAAEQDAQEQATAPGSRADTAAESDEGAAGEVGGTAARAGEAATTGAGEAAATGADTTRAVTAAAPAPAAEEAAAPAVPAAPAAAPAPLPAAPPPPPPAPEPEPAPAGGGVSCPVGQPRTYSDTWGAARSGGRAHKGTDILAPYGIPVQAYEDGTVTRASTNGLGGITLYLQGDSGAVYYYAHLAGYVGGIGAGVRVTSGQQIATNGDTGNARGIPHVHFEVMPGGGGSVNPYPYVVRACG